MAALRVPPRVPDAVQRVALLRRAGTQLHERARQVGPGSAARHFAPHCVRGTRVAALERFID